MKKLTSKEVINWLTDKYHLPEWELFTEVVNDMVGGTRHSRRADAIALSLWRQPEQKKLQFDNLVPKHIRTTVIGFEVKVNRADWLQELKQSEKAETMKQYCNEWILVAPEDVVKPFEIPKGWGWMIPNPQKYHYFEIRPEYNPNPKLDIEFVVNLVKSSAKKSQQINDIWKILMR
ncbi:MAG: hypothetical protein LBK82_00285 [Planctomycetaceae bacterium]|nr:hypothetical protein [Planctomycetaceae bacterium]